MNLKDMLKDAIKRMTEIKAAVEKGEKSAEDLQTVVDEVKDLKAKIKAAEDAENLLDGIGFIGEEKADEPKPAKNLGENFVNYVKAGQISGKKFRVEAPEFVKAYNDVQKTPTTSGVDAFATTFDRNVVTAPRVGLVIRDLFGAETISGSTLVYLVEGAIQGAPAVTNEGAKKPQVHFADPTPKTVSLSKIACFIKESDEYIHDYPFLASAINGRLLYHLQLVEQNKLVYDLLNTSGIQSDTTHWTAGTSAAGLADILLQAAMDVQEESGFPADAIAINPKDWYSLRIGKDGSNRYYGGGYFGGQNANDVWGIPVCVTTAVNPGQIIVGAWKTCGSVVQSGGISVEAVNTDQDDFVKNLMTIRAEERLALAVRRPKGFKVIEGGPNGATGAT